jgi:hypothetical protein
MSLGMIVVLMMLIEGLIIHVDVLFQSRHEPYHGYSGFLTMCFSGFLMSSVALHVASLHGWLVAIFS